MLLLKVKQALRITTDYMDNELKDLISAAKADMRITGIKVISDSDELIIQAVKTYCRANFGLGNADSEKYQRSYDLLKNHLSLCSEYTIGEGAANV